jgi:hypothetical protein
VNTAVELGCNAIVTERFGYSRLHLYCNLLANKARGQWMMLFNDDAVMSTKNWDSVIYNLPESILVADLESVHTAYGLCCFPVVRRWAVEVVGGFSLHTPHTDTYWQDVGRATGTIQQVPVFVMHERADITGQNNDQTRADMVADGFRSSQEYFGEHIQKLIRADIIKLTKLLDIQE